MPVLGLQKHYAEASARDGADEQKKQKKKPTRAKCLARTHVDALEGSLAKFFGRKKRTACRATNTRTCLREVRIFLLLVFPGAG